MTGNASGTPGSASSGTTAKLIKSSGLWLSVTIAIASVLSKKLSASWETNQLPPESKVTVVYCDPTSSNTWILREAESCHELSCHPVKTLSSNLGNNIKFKKDSQRIYIQNKWHGRKTQTPSTILWTINQRTIGHLIMQKPTRKLFFFWYKKIVAAVAEAWVASKTKHWKNQRFFARTLQTL